MLNQNSIDLLNSRVDFYNRSDFIENDPISVPHQFTRRQDIEIVALLAALFAWGQRKTIIKKSLELVERMDNSPYDFVLNHSEDDLKGLLDFKHRTFNGEDALNFIYFFNHHYSKNESLESAFVADSSALVSDTTWTTSSLISFKRYFSSVIPIDSRTLKHVASPISNATCKRLNMFLRWMVRKDDRGVDFGLWNKINPSQLLCPLDIHVGRVSRKLNLLSREQNDFKAVLELSENLRSLDPEDPCKYDYALFSLGVNESYA